MISPETGQPGSSTAADDLERILARMERRLDELRAVGDDRRIFLAVYATMTRAVHDGTRTGRFMDPAWTAALTARFAGLYFEAAGAWESGGAACPRPWCAAFAAAGQPRVSVIEHALLGINAHIVYDLPFAVAATMREAGDVVDGRLHGDTLVRRRHDYEVVNHILAETIASAQTVLSRESRVSALLDTLALRLDEYAAEALLRVSRTQGWHNALAIAVARDDAEEEAVRQHLDRVACSYVHRLDVTQFVPGVRVRRVLARFRPPFAAVIEHEQRDASDVAPLAAARRNRRHLHLV